MNWNELIEQKVKSEYLAPNYINKYENEQCTTWFHEPKTGGIAFKKNGNRKNPWSCKIQLSLQSKIMRENPGTRITYGYTKSRATSDQADYDGLCCVEQLIKDLWSIQYQINPDIPQYNKPWLHRHHFTGETPSERLTHKCRLCPKASTNMQTSATHNRNPRRSSRFKHQSLPEDANQHNELPVTLCNIHDPLLQELFASQQRDQNRNKNKKIKRILEIKIKIKRILEIKIAIPRIDKINVDFAQGSASESRLDSHHSKTCSNYEPESQRHEAA